MTYTPAINRDLRHPGAIWLFENCAFVSSSIRHFLYSFFMSLGKATLFAYSLLCQVVKVPIPRFINFTRGSYTPNSRATQ
jgi:hypothetical protein